MTRRAVGRCAAMPQLALALAETGLAQDPLAATPTALAQLLSDPDRAGGAVEALVALGPRAAPAVAAAVGRGAHAERAALLVLQRLGPSAAEVAPSLVERLAVCAPAHAPALYAALAAVLPLTEPTPKQLSDHLHVLTEQLLARGPDEAIGLEIRRGFVRVLIRAQISRNPDDDQIRGLVALNIAIGREYALERLSRRPELLRDHLPRLRELLAAEPAPADGGRHRAFGRTFPVEDRFAMLLACAIERAQGHGLDHVHRHRYWLWHGDVVQRVQSAMSLGFDAQRAKLAVPALCAAFDDPSPRVVGEALSSLGMLGGAAAAAAPRIEALGAHRDPQVAVRARNALRQIRAR